MQENPEKESEQNPPTAPKPLLTDPPYSGGSDIHIGEGQEHHLPHEGTHQPSRLKTSENTAQE
ncbi:hypothetical protein [Hymenobacter negativus]|uniref:Uncharacterized protein n=1 Tax=Hymenobacter negativus TaxID=2795026 RepID=A0ABS0Q2S7_9BACT|nr:hypothetical protein [Hymenobacter negativus]MBH8556885.1 hypothetical protein [Hymenobacter negativus]